MNLPITIRTLIISLVFPIFLYACSGSGPNDNSNPGSNAPIASILSGRFIDSAVEGLTFQSGDLVGVTDNRGTFEYEQLNGASQAVTFSFNGVELGTTIGKAIVTPLDLVQNSDLDTIEVQNIARFIQMLDTDGNPNNGIVPSMDLLTAILAFDWLPVNFSDNDFATQPTVTQIIADLSSVDSQAHSVPSASAATFHLRQTLACQSSGIYSGEFSGEDNGHFVLWVQHQRIDPLAFGDTESHIGVTSAYLYSQKEDRLIGLSPQEGLQFNSSNDFVAGRANNGAEFTGNFKDYNSISNGVWRNDLEGGEGTFFAARIAGDTAAKYRLGGAVGVVNILEATADNTGAIALDIFADYRVSGIAMTSRGDRYNVTGALQGDVLTAISSEGLTITMIYDATGSHSDNISVGLFGQPGFWGTWQLGVDSGVVIGTSCRLTN